MSPTFFQSQVTDIPYPNEARLTATNIIVKQSVDSLKLFTISARGICLKLKRLYLSTLKTVRLLLLAHLSIKHGFRADLARTYADKIQGPSIPDP